MMEREIDIRAFLTGIDSSISDDAIIAAVNEALRTPEFVQRMWGIGTFHDAYVTRVADKNGKIFEDSFSHFEEVADNDDA